jgi:hypothetical protein
MKALKSIFLIVSVLMLTACSAPLTIKDSSVMRTDGQKIKEIQLIYIDATMRTISQESWGRPVSTANTEFGIFGDSVVKRAEPVFSKRGVSVVSASVQDDRKPLQLAASASKEDASRIPLLLITPTYGKVSGNGRATTANYVFVARLVDGAGKPVRWRATIDTNAWIGQDLILKNISGTKYDAEFAEKFLSAIADQMQKDGLIF